uniref:Large subunit ribosomal protein L32 n=1 Tax=Rhipicephalus appendiculatus TaxID=34631 RepID=A0A131Z6M2_RHIAP
MAFFSVVEKILKMSDALLNGAARFACLSQPQRHCYGKVKQETEQLRDAIAQRLKLEPVETEVVVSYQGEKKQGHCVVAEVDRPRPAWFTKNLMK